MPYRARLVMPLRPRYSCARPGTLAGRDPQPAGPWRQRIPRTPWIGGQPSFFVVAQLFLFRRGSRRDAAMSEVARAMTDDDHFFAHLTHP
jgi:hypothetical protein